MILVSFRFDDPSLVSNHKLEEDIFTIFEKHGINLCVGVVPFSENAEGAIPLTRDKAEHLIKALQKNVIEIALHGYSHTQRSKTINGAPSEFVDLPEEQQATFIHQGRLHLSELFKTAINCFIPPFNTYDSITEKVLRNEGFTHVSAGFETPTPSELSIPNLPRTAHLHDARAAIEQALLYKNLDCIINVLFHHFDFEEHNPDKAVINLKKLDELLGWINANEMITNAHLSDAAKAFETFSTRYYQYQRLIKSLPDRLQWRFPQSLVFLSPTWKIILNVIGVQLKKHIGVA